VAGTLTVRTASATLAEDCRQRVHSAPNVAIELCERAYAENAADATLAEEMLFRRSDAELAAGGYDAAASTLDRVAGLPGQDWKRLFRLERRRGILDYRRDRFAEALSHFRAGYRLADLHADAVSLGQAGNDVGNALRRIGEFRDALQAYLGSLEAKRKSGDKQLGPLLNNIGDLYRDLEEPENAERFYAEALAEHERAGHTLDAAHTLEAIGVLALDRGDVDSALKSLGKAYDTFTQGDSPPDALRLCVQLARAALASADPAHAQEWVTRGNALVRDHRLPPSTELVLQDARVRAAQGKGREARDLLEATLKTLPEPGLERIPLLEELAKEASAQGDFAEAYASFQKFHSADARRHKAEHDEQLTQLRVRFEVDEKDREIRLLEAETKSRTLEVRQRTTQLELLAALSLLTLAALALGFQRRQQQARVAAAARQARLDAEIAQYRQAALDLGMDRQRLQAALDRSEEAVIVLEGDRAAALNAAAARWLGLAPAQATGEALTTRIAGLGAALAMLDESGQEQQLALPGMQGRLVALDEGLALLSLRAAGKPDRADPTLERFAAAPALPGPIEDESSIASADSDAFRRDLVELMLATLAAWERSTGSSRIELAEKSRVWRVTIDEGRLRVRALERYLSLAKLPRLPRWREVLRTAYFVLAECALDDTERADLKRRVENLQAAVRRRAMQ
jgi:two-component system sensor histidine kinase ChiS